MVGDSVQEGAVRRRGSWYCICISIRICIYLHFYHFHHFFVFVLVLVFVFNICPEMTLMRMAKVEVVCRKER